MKFFVLLFLVGCAAANLHEVLEEEAEYVYQQLMFNLEDSGALKDALGYDLLQQAEEDIKTEMGKRLKEDLNDILEKIKDAIRNGKLVSEDMQNKAKEIREKLKDLRVELGNKLREKIQDIKEKAKDFWDKLKDAFKGDDSKRSIDDRELASLNFREMFEKLKQTLRDRVDKEKLKAKVEELFGKGSEMADSLLDIINEKGEKYKQKLLDLVDRYLGKKEEEKRSIQEYWEKIKEYFKDLQLDLKEKYMKFGEWVKENFNKKVAEGKDKVKNLKEIAQEFIDHGKGVSKDVAREAKEFLRPYKEDLGSLWQQVKDTVQDIMNRQD